MVETLVKEKTIREKLESLSDKEWYALSLSRYLGGFDMNVNDRNPKWEDAKLRVLITINGNYEAKISSATLIQLFQIAHHSKYGKDIYIDFCMQPNANDVPILRSHNIPEAFGWVSMHSMNDFDVISSSFSVHYECMNVYPLYLGGGVEPFHYDRCEKKNAPFIMGGGNTAIFLENLHGSKHGSLLDIMMFGEGETRYAEVLDVLFENRDILKTDRVKVIEKLCKKFDNIYYPNGYNVECEIKDMVHRCVKFEPKYDWVPEKVEFYRDYSTAPHMFEEKIMVSNNDTYHRAEVMISKSCNANCSFCAECQEGGPWREFDVEAVKKALLTTRKYNAPNKVSLFSYNSNFYSKIGEIYEFINANFESTSVITLRADCLSEMESHVQLVKSLGTFKMSVALEGISETIRNKFLNKNLSWDQVLRAGSYLFKNRFISMKMNLILTGYETQSDMDEFVYYMGELLKIRDLTGANTSILLSITTLVHYDACMLAEVPRLSTVCELRRLTPMRNMIKKLKDMGIKAKYNSGMGFAYQQLMVDLGRTMTDIVLPLYKEYWEQNKSTVSDTSFKRYIGECFQKLGFCEDISFDEMLEEVRARRKQYIAEMDALNDDAADEDMETGG